MSTAFSAAVLLLLLPLWSTAQGLEIYLDERQLQPASGSVSEVPVPSSESLLPDSSERRAADPRALIQRKLPPLTLREASYSRDIQPLRPAPGGSAQIPSWVFFWLSVLLLLLAVIRVQFYRDIREWWRALMNPNLAHQLQRDREFALTPHGILLFALFVAAMGTWIWLLLYRLGWSSLPLAGSASLPVCILAVMFVFFLRDALRRLTGMLFRATDSMALFGFEITLIQALAGALLLPFLFVLAFAPEPLALGGWWASSLLLAGLYGWRSFRGLQAGLGGRQRNHFAFVLYVCTLEIAPLAVVIKTLSVWFSNT